MYVVTVIFIIMAWFYKYVEPRVNEERKSSMPSSSSSSSSSAGYKIKSIEDGHDEKGEDATYEKPALDNDDRKSQSSAGSSEIEHF